MNKIFYWLSIVSCILISCGKNDIFSQDVVQVFNDNKAGALITKLGKIEYDDKFNLLLLGRIRGEIDHIKWCSKNPISGMLIAVDPIIDGTAFDYERDAQKNFIIHIKMKNEKSIMPAKVNLKLYEYGYNVGQARDTMEQDPVISFTDEINFAQFTSENGYSKKFHTSRNGNNLDTHLGFFAKIEFQNADGSIFSGNFCFSKISKSIELIN